MAGRNNNNNDMNEVVRQLAIVAQQLAERNNNNNPDLAGELFKQIAQSKPPTYQGEPDPTVLENWLIEFDKLFVVIACPNESKVSIAAYYLRGEADLKWQQNEQAVRALPKFRWNVFKEQVRDKLYPIFLQKQKADEFLELKMGSMSVTEYYTKFIELSRFTEGTVATDRQKARRFERGLPLSLQRKLSGQVFYNLDELAYEYFSKNKGGQGNNQFKGSGQNWNQQKGGQGSNGNQVNKGTQFQNGNKNTNSGNTQVKGGTPGKLIVMGSRKAYVARDVITGTCSINSVSVKVLFYFGATYSFISKAMLPKLSHCLKIVEDIDIPIELPNEGVVHCTRVYKDVPIKIKGKEFLSNLIEFELGYLEIIPGMDWLCRYHAEIRCQTQKLHLKTTQGEIVTHWRHGKPKHTKIIFVVKLAKYMKKGNLIYFYSVRNLEYEEPSKLEDTEIVREFLDVFPKEIPSMPPKRTIDLVPGTAPISKASYRMVPTDMSELKSQSQDLLEKGYI
ncbi:uncharacterized protein LOC110703002 [Chenopodium quinoa]|uniref:uncharacterized protein LOC110703002 n=1 Tax=Chenopodium quinoa TaxID=63459 RepID=UPI000B7953DE|nr:uncharacterized protein LOC110703002 [Chenopodium quinoa]